MKRYKLFFIKILKSIYLKLKKIFYYIYIFKIKKEFFIKKNKKKTFNLIYNSKFYSIIYKYENVNLFNFKFNKRQDLISYYFFLKGKKVFFNKRCGIVHRIDHKTCGITLLANNQFYYNFFLRLFKQRKVKKYYLVLLKTNDFIKNKKFLIKGYIKNKTFYKTKLHKSKFSYTILKKILFYKKKNLFLCKIITGRKKQIKIHCSYLFKIKFKQIFLQFWKISFCINKKFTYYSLINKKILNLFKKTKKKLI
ncbi:pseudouridine synthase [Candidatus Vidania fulgoroideorum]